GAWGGWHDAGDFDRRSKHQVCSRVLFELLECHGEWAGVELAIPERGGELPDLLDEALWGLDLFVRLQRADGAVRGGIETPGHPVRPDASFNDRLPVYVFAPDVRASWIHAATAAQAAWVLEDLGLAERAGAYRDSALRAMAWAETTFSAEPDRYAELKRGWHLKDHRHLAAVHCYRLTGDERWHEVARETAIWKDGEGTWRWNVGLQEEAAFVYARLGDALVDDELRAAARASLAADARKQIAYARAQAFDFTAMDLGMPLQMGAFSTPNGSALVRHYLLSGDDEALAWAIRSCGFALGANPMNTTFTTGLGQRSPKQPLYIDLWAMGLEEPPPGITIYGNLDPVFRHRDWGWDTIAGPGRMVPPVREWPLAETWCDVSHWVFMNEYTIDRNIAPSVLVYGHLAGRD
nr:glycoside hydrolase family 9 protein [Planctomycetota bacterium]